MVAELMTQMPRCAIRETVDKPDDGNSVAVCATQNTLVGTRCLFFEIVRWRRRKARQQSRRRCGLGGFAFVPNPCRVPRRHRLVVEDGNEAANFTCASVPGAGWDARSDVQSIVLAPKGVSAL